MSNMRTPTGLRFWQYVNGSPVRLHIKEGDTLIWAKTVGTEEGFHDEYLELWMECGRVYCESITGGRDCDGYIERHWTGLMIEADSIPDPDGIRDCHGKVIRYPSWERLASASAQTLSEAK